jgi:hypothetical protein
MTAPFAIGDAVECIDWKPRGEWQAYFLDENYTEGLLRPLVRYVVRDLHPPIDAIPEWGVDVGAGCADGSRWWGASRFRLCLLREPIRLGAVQEQSV